MKKKTILLLVLLLQMAMSFAQQNNYNEILKAATAEADKDTEDSYGNAAKMLEPFADTMNGNDLNRMGFYFWKTNNYTKSLKYFKISASKGDNGGIYDLGYAYENGHGVEIDKNVAYFYYMKVKPDYDGIDEVYHNIGHLCEEGYNNDGNKPDYEAAAAYFIKAADLGNGESMYHLGNYYNADGRLTTDLKLAKQWYEKACKADKQDACEALKKIGSTGIEKKTKGVPQMQNEKLEEKNQISSEIFETTGSIIIQNAQEIREQKMLLDWDYVQLNSASEAKAFLKKNGYALDSLEKYFSEEGGTNIVLYHQVFKDRFVYLRLIKDYKAVASLQQYSQNKFPFFPVRKLLDRIKFIEKDTKKQLSSIELSEAIAKAIALKGEVVVAIISDDGNMTAYKFFIEKDDFAGSLLVQNLRHKEKGEFNASDYEIQYKTTYYFGIIQQSTDDDDIGKIPVFK